MKTVVSVGAIFQIALGALHALHVARASDVEPYLWVASLFLIIQGAVTLKFLRSIQDHV